MASKSPRTARTKAAPVNTAEAAIAPAITDTPSAWPLAPARPAEAAPESVQTSAEAAPSPVIPGLQKLAEAEAEIAAEAEADIADAIANQVVEPAVAPAPATVKETIVDTMNTVADKAQTYFTDAQGKAKAAWEKSQSAFADMTEFSKGNVEALVESGKIAARGFESLSREAVDYSKKSFETGVAAAREMTAIKSPTDLFKLHGDFVRSSFDSLVAETSKNTETMLKLAGEIAQPISNRIAVAAEKVKIAA